MARKAEATPHPLESWHVLQTQIHGMSEQQLEKLIEEECAGKARRNMVLRMHMKLNKLRYRREKEDFIKRTKLHRHYG